LGKAYTYLSMSLVDYGSDGEESGHKKKRKKKRKKTDAAAATAPEPAVEGQKEAKGDGTEERRAEKPQKVVLPAAADLLGGGGSKPEYLSQAPELEAFINTLHEGDLILQAAKPKNSVTSKIADAERRKHALNLSRAKREAQFQAQADERERDKLESWKRVQFERKDEWGNLIKPAPVDPRGKSLHKYH